MQEAGREGRGIDQYVQFQAGWIGRWIQLPQLRHKRERVYGYRIWNEYVADMSLSAMWNVDCHSSRNPVPSQRHWASESGRERKVLLELSAQIWARPTWEEPQHHYRKLFQGRNHCSHVQWRQARQVHGCHKRIVNNNYAMGGRCFSLPSSCLERRTWAESSQQRHNTKRRFER